MDKKALSNKAILLFNVGACGLMPEETGLLIQGELHYFREKMREVVFIYDREPKEGDLRPRLLEKVIKKPTANAFFNTDLLAHLSRQKVEVLTMVGGCSHDSILLTAAQALDLGFKVVVPEPLIYGLSDLLHESAVTLINSYIKEQRYERTLYTRALLSEKVPIL